MSKPVEGGRAEGWPERVLKGVLIGVILFMCLGLPGAEIWFRHHLHPVADQREHVFLRPPLRRMQVQVSRDVPGLPKRETLFTTNSLGLRGDELDLSTHESLRIITLGGSVTECMVLSDEDAWPHRLQAELTARTGKPVWVGNAGRSGEMTLDYIAHAQVLLPAFDPDVVVVMPGGNDLQAVAENRYFPLDLSNLNTLFQYSRKLYTAGDTALLDPFYAYYMYERYMETTSADIAPLYMRMKRARFAAKKLPSIPDFEEAIDIYRANLRSLYTMLTRLRGEPRIVFMTHPFLWHDGMDKAAEQALWAGYTCMGCPTRSFYAHQALAEALTTFNKELMRFCSDMGMSCFDLEPKLPKTLENFYDDGHLKEPGARLLGQLLSAFIAEQGLTNINARLKSHN